MASDITTLNGDTAAADVSDHGSFMPADAALPAGRLDADNYHAEDLDGVTESVFGSGNLNYLTLQGRQTDAMLLANGFENGAKSQTADHALGSIGGSAAHVLAGTDNGNAKPGGISGLTDAAGGGAAQLTSHTPLTALAQPAISGGGALSSHAFSADFTHMMHSVNNLETSGLNGTSGANGHDGTTPGPGPTPDPGPHPDPTPTPAPASDIDLFAHNDLGLSNLDLNLDPIEHIVGDIGIGVTETHGPDGAGLGVGAIAAGIPIINTTLVPAIPGVTDHVFALVDTASNLVDPNTLAHDPVGSAGALADGIVAATGLDAPAVSPLLAPLESATAPVTEALSPVLDMATNLISSSALQGPVTDIGTLADHLVSATGLDPQGLIGGLSPVTDMISPTIGMALGTTDATGLAHDPASGLDGLAGGLLSGTGIDAPDSSGILSSVLDITGGNPVTADPVATVDNLLNPVLDEANLGNSGLTDTLAPVLDTVSGLTGGETLPADPGAVVENILNPLSGGEGSGLTDALAPVLDTVTHLGGSGDPAGAITDIAGGLLGGGAPSGGDSDLFVHNDAGLPQIDLPNPLAAITGGGDTGLGLTHDASSVGAGAVLSDTPLISEQVPVGLSSVTGTLPQDPASAVTDITGGLLNGIAPSSGGDSDLFVHNDAGLPQIDLPNPLAALTGGGDTGIGATHDTGSVTADATLSDTSLVHEQVPVSVPSAPDLSGTADSIISQAGTISTTADSAINMLLPVADIAAPSAAAADTGAAWPQTATSGVSASVADTLGSLIGGDADAAHALPAPVGSVSEGLGLLNTGSDHGGSSLSGLHSGHLGGLFG